MVRNATSNGHFFPGCNTRLRSPASARRKGTVFRVEGSREDPQKWPHTLRKTFTRLIYPLGHDLVRTSCTMRHASVGTTVQYLSFRAEEVDAAILTIQ